MSQNCRIKPISFVITFNEINRQFCLHDNHRKFIQVTKKHFDFYIQNYDCLKQEVMSGKLWFFKSKQKSNG